MPRWLSFGPFGTQGQPRDIESATQGSGDGPYQVGIDRANVSLDTDFFPGFSLGTGCIARPDADAHGPVRPGIGRHLDAYGNAQCFTRGHHQHQLIERHRPAIVTGHRLQFRLERVTAVVGDLQCAEDLLPVIAECRDRSGIQRELQVRCQGLRDRQYLSAGKLQSQAVELPAGINAYLVSITGWHVHAVECGFRLVGLTHTI